MSDSKNNLKQKLINSAYKFLLSNEIQKALQEERVCIGRFKVDNQSIHLFIDTMT
jgi:hypothetical protein